MSEISQILKNIGFETNEAKIYLSALELGEAPASEIAYKAKIKRPSAYVLLKALHKKGYMASYTKKKLMYFVALDPSVIISTILERAKKAEAVLPELKALFSSDSTNKPRVEYYEGHDGLVAIMEDTLVVPNKTIYTWANIDTIWSSLKDYYPTYIRKKNEKNIFNYAICTDSDLATRFKTHGQTERRELLIVPKEKFPMTNEINIYEDKIFIISHKDQMGVIIKNKEIADTQRSIFELCWEGAKLYDKNSTKNPRRN
ncbi:MAG: hypothetical protein A2821_01695 [Candidatus Magasanikbacteria bacterium RIFCSPHIGHO2_01_FULL_41_23]|uniref:Transcription regulator TrmB N-terminal domain-containing protein n=1 Tax=Candidatus Magasanikbacteria bacterium RIFCSPLOWO2_01_FULL_40_15 TaxID=1798686 RepID=A0A1F6N331_9BACT|nr:MAG: hypothetical protein A2821_01695 [Candidatus Magasanikbacteria bacterium RIFCSPHIGHO2_01_FULL_41_23]OGH75037.1 MAG: hypothetical protein A3F22_00405 [Candidatus Magasanikbacteria bacterium RIFCSPHIGHO2_12_FULL_41_16]OGH78291.1 MAG: hypothetical protein A2983_04010 [Candidatus Magasanikbacteria bacterium RIFCSPLOWO2_01_FULL_40_15]